MPLSFLHYLLDGDLGGTGFSRCDEKRLLRGFFAQAKACATLSCARNGPPQPKTAPHPDLKQ
jgi:hypothetical protein